MSGALGTVALVRAREPQGGAEGGGHEEAPSFLGLPFVAWQALNLVLFLFLLYKLLKKPLTNWVSARRDSVAQQLRDAEEKRGRTEALAKELAARLARIEEEIAELKSHSEKEAVAEQAALTAQAAADAERIVQRAAAEIDSRVRTARKELTAYAGDLALEIATDLLKRNLTPEDQVRLVREGIASLGALPGAKSGKG